MESACSPATSVGALDTPPSFSGEVMERLQSFVGGRWVDGGGAPVVLTNPATEEPVAEVRNGFDTQGALTHARAAGAALRKLTFAERGALLQEMSRVLHADRER